MSGGGSGYTMIFVCKLINAFGFDNIKNKDDLNSNDFLKIKSIIRTVSMIGFQLT